MTRIDCFRAGVLALLLFAFSANAKIITVTTTNNVSPGPGETNLIQAISLLADGDAIHFNIPGPGPFYLVTPPLSPDNGYPAITNNNITIDGYTQPGSSPNTNPILSSNNANIQIVLDSRTGGARLENVGSYTNESAVLLVKVATNVTVRGLCFLGPGHGAQTADNPLHYGISFSLGAGYGHVNGCRFGLDLDNTTVCPLDDAVTGFQAGSSYIDGTTVGVDKNAQDGASARSQFNVMIGEFIHVILEGENHRISGNFFNVFPDGNTDFNADQTDGHDFESFVEIGRKCNNLVLGTDSDGFNDSDEHNIFGGAFSTKEAIVELYGGSHIYTNVIIAGNYIGVGVDGTTRFTNSIEVFSGGSAGSTTRLGSDLDGFEDALEANVISMNYPFEELYADPSISVPPVFSMQINTLAPVPPVVSLRGNRLSGNNVAPFSYFRSNTGHDASTANSFTNTYTAFMETNNLVPSISTGSSICHLRGVCAVGKPPYTNVMIDVYVANPEGWNNGALTHTPDLAYVDPVTSASGFYGYPQGETYLGTFIENGPQDLDPAPGRFQFDISSLPIPPGAMLTLNANYSAAPAGTSNAVTVTTIFANPIVLQPALSVSSESGMARLSWPSPAGAFQIETTSDLQSGSWMPLNPQPMIWLEGTEYAVYVPSDSGSAYFRLTK